MTLEEFIKAIDRNIEMRCGISIHDLPDIDFYSYWEGGTGNWDNQVREAANDAISRA